MSNAYFETNEGSGEAEELERWLKQNKLDTVSDEFHKLNVTLQELREFTEDDAKNYAKELNLSFLLKKRFIKAITLLSNANDNKAKQKQAPTNIVRIVLSKEEDDAINNINNKKKEINQNINNISNDIKNMKKMAKTNQSQLNILKNEFILKINETINALILKSNKTINSKTNILSNHINKLTNYNKQLNDAETEINKLLNDVSINKLKRKTKIINISQALLNNNYTNPNVTPKVTVDIHKNEIFKYINNIASIKDWNYPEIPVISVNNIKDKSATVNFNNIQPKYQCFVELMTMKDKDDQKVNWKTIASNITKQNNYNISGLKALTNYKVKVKFKNDYGDGKYSKITSFLTKKATGPNINSLILTSSEKAMFLSLLIEKGKNIGKSWNLLFRGTRDGFDVNVFKSKCHGKQNLMCFIKTTNDNVFGGYTASGWPSGNTAGAVADAHAFIFLIRSSANYPPAIFNTINAKQALYNTSGYYCIFGYNDWYFWCNSNKTVSFNQNPQTDYGKLPQEYYFNGKTKSTSAQVAEIEVFKLQ